PPPNATLLPYTTLFRSLAAHRDLATADRALLVHRRTHPRSLDVRGDGLAMAARRIGAGGGGIATVGPVLGGGADGGGGGEQKGRSEEHTSELQSRENLV